jgi:REP element-mobilizing transposase RayT
MTGEALNVTRRHLPHWTIAEATYFITFRVKHGNLSVSEQRLVLEHIKKGDPGFYKLAIAVVMPDHVHILLRPNPDRSLSQILKGMKGSIARELNRRRRTSGSIWQDESFDRIMRDPNEFNQKLEYTLNNPVRKGLSDDPLTYHGVFLNEHYLE